MKSRVQKWGNSLAVRIPKSFAIEAHLDLDTLVDMSVRDGELVVSPIIPRYSLTQMLEQVTDENRHGEVDFGPAVGLEVW